MKKPGRRLPGFFISEPIAGLGYQATSRRVLTSCGRFVQKHSLTLEITPKISESTTEQ